MDDSDKDRPREAYAAGDIPGWEGEMDQTFALGNGGLVGQSSDAEVDKSHYSEAENGWAETAGL